MQISHNLMAMNANRILGINGGKHAKSTEKLSSGYRINRSADDAAGLAISEKMRRQIRGLTQADRNAQDGISLIQTAEGGLNEVHEMLQRMNELAVKGSNGTLSQEDRTYIDSEIQQLKREINRVADSCTFNEIQLFPNDGSSFRTATYEFRLNADGTYTAMALSDSFTFAKDAVAGNALQLADHVITTLLPQAFSDILQAFPALATDQGDLNVKVQLDYIDGASGTLAYASYVYSPSNNYAPVKNGFTIKIDTADFTDENAMVGKPAYDKLKSTVYHELTHSIMQYGLTKGMAKEYPEWFQEGTAQLAGGGFSTGWLNLLANGIKELTGADDTSRDEYIKNFLNGNSLQVSTYGIGYLVVSYIGQLASGQTDVSS